jgi:flagellar hook-associated protein 1
MTTGIMSIGVTGMQAAQLGLMTTQHNIANASTPGYSRQRTVQGTNTPLSTGAGFVGQGVHISTIARMYSDVLNSQVVSSQASVSQLSAFSKEISQIDNLLGDTTSGVSPALQAFFNGVQGVAADPSSLDARQSMVSSAQALTARFNSMNSRLTEMYDGVNSQIKSNVAAVNSYATQIASLNERIIVAQSSTNQPANDLLDQRDQLVSELNKLVGVKTTTQSNGSYSVTFGTGQALVVGTTVTTMTATPSSADPSRIVVGLKNGASTQELPESLITGGTLGGLISYRKDALEPAMNELGRVAASLAQTFNAQNAQGKDLLGNSQASGTPPFQPDFFVISPSTPKIVGNSANSAAATLSAGFAPVSTNGTNFYSNLTASDYKLALNGTTYTLTRLTDGQSWSDTSVASLSTTVSATEGFTFTGSMASGDSFLIQPTRDMSKNLSVNTAIANDPRLIAAAGASASATPVTAVASNSATSITVPTVTTGTAPAMGATVTLTAAVTGASTALNLKGLANPTVITYIDASNVSHTVTATTGTATIPYAAGKAISLNNVSFTISGSPANGDTFTVTNNSGASDGRNAVLLGKLQTQKTTSGATATYQSSYAQLVSDIGNKTREAQVTETAQQSLLDQATTSRDALSGVNLDEEAANLLNYQQAYQAAAKMLQIGTKLFDTLLAIGA